MPPYLTALLYCILNLSSESKSVDVFKKYFSASPNALVSFDGFLKHFRSEAEPEDLRLMCSDLINFVEQESSADSKNSFHNSRVYQCKLF